ncbi:phosphatase PAP2 family protein [Litorivicinus lipolyticus]|nr:phosphatase PAP2 family protein [Litorivicinus lipolyticus]
MPATPFRPLIGLLTLVIAVAVAIEWAQADLWLADRIFEVQGGRWVLREHWLLEDLLHSAGRTLSALCALVVLLVAGYRGWRYSFKAALPEAVLFASLITSTALVSALKRVTQVGCPWDYQRYGGSHSYHPIFSPRAATDLALNCFPGGHASAGYAWVALYAYALYRQPRWAMAGLGVGLGMGIIFDVTQQLRGAHFISHGLWSLIIALSVTLFAVHRLDRTHGALT